MDDDNISRYITAAYIAMRRGTLIDDDDDDVSRYIGAAYIAMRRGTLIDDDDKSRYITAA
jgi:hypothetical protein